MEFKRYVKKKVIEIRPVTQATIDNCVKFGNIIYHFECEDPNKCVMLSQKDKLNGSPKLGDMIARNPHNHGEQWLISEADFKDNYLCID